jgi:L-threonylcarbamoyladenylate synthase
LIEEFWPGPLTLVFKVSTRLKEFAFRNLETIAIRIPDCAICLALLKVCGFPIVSTSANKSGGPDATIAERVRETFGDNLDLIIDGGETPSRTPSTIVDITRTPARIVREGAISALEVKTVLEII